MAIPPFPPQDLAKLVLGYLAEEHLMTVYDEFLYASPYLDAMTNEYDRLIMKPLRNILAEYRAVKIYVETCKPFSLRKQLYLCSNLFDMVKFLVSIIDLNKLRTYDANRRENISSIIQDVANNPPLCHVCKSFRLPTCDCRYKELDSIHSSKDNSSKATATSKQLFVEATALGDLPGNTAAKGRRIKSVGKGAKNVCSNLDQYANNGRSSKSSTMPETQCSETMSHNDNCTPEELHSPIRAHVEDSCKSAEIDDLVDVMYNGNQVAVCQTMPIAESFQEFPTVIGEQNMSGITSSTSIVRQDSVNVENIGSQNTKADNINTKTAKSSTKKVQNKKNSKRSNDSNVKHMINDRNESSTGVLEPQNLEQKITILSDIRMERDLASCSYKMHPVLKNATSTPLMQTQDIVINGMPAYKPNPVPVPACNYSNDEIMAMPTIILVPTSASSHAPNDTSYVARPQESTATSKVACINPQVSTLGPLTIDITDSPVSSKANNVVKNTSVDLPNLDTEPYLVKIADNIKTTTLPKDASHNPGTPQILPPIRKSSSTPRRTSHVRVLDFTTPRRILHETINEHVSNNNDSEANVADINKNAQMIQSNDGPISKAFENTLDLTADKNSEIINKSLKENSTKTIKKPTKLTNWDSDLRVHVGGNEINDFSKHSPKRVKKNKIAKRNTPKNSSETISECDRKSNKKSNHRKKVSPDKIKKKRRKSDKDIASSAKVIEETGKKVVKPTINIIPGDDWGSSSKSKDEGQSLQSKEPDVVADVERIDLQNVIGAKLNISHLLETPYKQALYDIQMDTPRFLGTEILPSDSPVTDIKILNIPTPQFFDCPNLSSKRGQATPSSYSSRPTDYSSGGSYYKPDDQDYLPILETFEGTSKTEKQKALKTKLPKSINDDKEKACSVKSGRPVRQCTKNVSYYNSPCVKTKAPDANDKHETSSNSDKAEHNDAHESIIESDSIPKQDNKIRNHKSKKSDSSTTNNRSPAKKELLKIKPRFTPKKVLPAKKHKRSLSQNMAKQQTKKRSIGKSTLVTPVVVAAPTKSRRKSSTPRKLHCTETANTESSTEKSAVCDLRKMQLNKTSASTLKTQDSDVEQLPLQWSDDGSEEPKLKRTPRNTSVSESDDISKIKDYIAKDLNESPRDQTVCDKSLKTFDVESAKLIERDLCDTSPRIKETVSNKLEISHTSSEITGELTIEPELNSDTANNEQVLIEEDEIELSVHECNELSCNYLSFEYEDYDSLPEREPVRLKDKFSMDVVLDDTVSVRLRATSFMMLFDHHEPEELSLDYRETENAVNTICNYDKLYTPLKESVKARCYDIFDSTLTSLDTPLKSNKINSPEKAVHKQTVTEVVLEVEQILDESAEKEEINLKRKRLQSETNSEDSVGDSKRMKKETEYDPASTLKNMDIESVLSKLHGP